MKKTISSFLLISLLLAGCTSSDISNTEEDSKSDHVHQIEHRTENYIDPTCTNDGGYDVVSYCSICGEEISRININISAIGHNFSIPTYTWSEDHKTCTAKRICQNDSNHIEEETVNSEYQLIESATSSKEGKTKYRANFVNQAFLGHRTGILGCSTAEMKMSLGC